jgi:hypothetical protein
LTNLTGLLIVRCLLLIIDLLAGNVDQLPSMFANRRAELARDLDYGDPN